MIIYLNYLNSSTVIFCWNCFGSKDAGDRIAMTVRREGKLVQWSYAEYLKDITSVAKAFIHLGLEIHNGVAIWGFNSPEWFISDLAAIFAGGVVSVKLECLLQIERNVFTKKWSSLIAKNEKILRLRRKKVS